MHPQLFSISERTRRVLLVGTWIVLAAVALPALGQDDVTTQNATSALDGGWITGPASNPLSHLNGPAWRTDASSEPYDFRDVAPATYLDERLPNWVNFQVEERYRFESYDNSSFKEGSNDSYELNRFRAQLNLHAGTWFRFTSQVQDARPFFENPPLGPPNENRWDLKLAYAEIGAPEHHWVSLRVGRQIINYNNTIIANSEWRDQGRSYDAAVVNLQSRGASVGIFAASAVVPLASGISHHQEGNNIYGAYGRLKNVWHNADLEPFVLWRVQQAAVIEPAVAKTTGKQDEKAWGLRLKGHALAGLDYEAQEIIETGKVGTEPIRAWATSDGVAYQFTKSVGKPRIFTQYDYATGNGSPGDGRHRTFDTMYPTAHDRFGIADLFGWQNIEAVRAGATVEVHRRWSVSAQGLDYWAASAKDAIYNTSGNSIGYNKTNNGTHVGAEVDGYTWYELNRHFNIGGGYGYFGGGSFLAHVGTSHGYNYSYIAINFKDNGKRARE